MKEELKLVKIDYRYCDYLRRYDKKVSYNSGSKELRPFIGVLLYVENFKYFAPLSSPKIKHLKMKNNVDFLKIDNGKLGAINFNNMLPVLEQNIKLLDLNKVCENKEESKYQKMLKTQLYWLNRHNKSLFKHAKNLYDSYLNDKLPIKIKERCCNFSILEEKCLEYNKNK